MLRLQPGLPGSSRCCEHAVMETALGLVARRQFPKARRIQERERLETQTLQSGSLCFLYYNSQKPRWVLGESGRSQGRQRTRKRHTELIWGAGLGESSQELFTGIRTSQLGVKSWLLAPKERAERGAGICHRRRNRAHLCSSQGIEFAGKEAPVL